MVKLKGAFTLCTLLCLTACTSSSPYSRLGNPSLEQVLIEHAAKVQSIPDKKATKTEDKAQPQVPKHIEKMYKEWTQMKPQLKKLIELEEKIAIAAAKAQQARSQAQKAQPQKAPTQTAKAAKSSKSEQEQREYVSPPITQSKAMTSTPDAPEAKYVIQIGASTSEKGANNFWLAQKRKFPSFLNNVEPKIEHVKKSGKSVYRVKIGAFIAYRQAQRACDTFQMLGGQCIVKKIKKAK